MHPGPQRVHQAWGADRLVAARRSGAAARGHSAHPGQTAAAVSRPPGVSTRDGQSVTRDPLQPSRDCLPRSASLHSRLLTVAKERPDGPGSYL